MKKTINTALALAFGLALSINAATYVTDVMVTEMAAQGRIPVIVGLDSVQADTVVSAAMFADTSFSDTVAGITSQVVTIACSRNRSVITCTVPGATGSGTGTALTLQAFPAGWRPAVATTQGGLQVTDNSVVTRAGSVSLATSGVPTFSFASTAGVPTATFTNSGTRAFSTFVITFKK